MTVGVGRRALDGLCARRNVGVDERIWRQPRVSIMSTDNTQAASDAAYKAGLAEQRHRVEELAAACAVDEHVLVRELRDHGIDVTSVWDFIASGGAPPPAIPILVAHLTMDHHQRIWEGIVRALAVNHARGAAFAALTEQYRQYESRTRRTVLAHTIAAMARLDEVQDLPEIESYRSLFR
jgi:hypothetical protein